MKCTNCGTEFEEGLFCPECGTKNDEGNIQEIISEDELKPENINEQETGKKSKTKKEKPAKEKKTKTGIFALISGILGFLTSLFVVGIIFDIVAIIMAFVSKKKGASKAIAYISLILGISGTAIFGVCLAYTMMQEPEVESLIFGIVGFLIIVFVVGIIFDIVAIIMAFVSKKKGASKAIAYISLILGISGTAIFGVCLAYTIMHEREVSHGVYGDIVDMVNEGKLEEAKEAIETAYGSFSYSSLEGFNKTSIYYIYYKATEEYDELATVLADYLEAVLADYPGENNKEFSVNYRIEVYTTKARYEEIADKISPENKERIEALLNNEIIEALLKEFENMQ